MLRLLLSATEVPLRRAFKSSSPLELLPRLQQGAALMLGSSSPVFRLNSSVGATECDCKSAKFLDACFLEEQRRVPLLS